MTYGAPGIGSAQAARAVRDFRAELLDAVGWLNRAVRGPGAVSFLTVALRFFPRTAPVVDAVRLYLADPIRTIGLAIAQYLPNLGLSLNGDRIPWMARACGCCATCSARWGTATW